MHPPHTPDTPPRRIKSNILFNIALVCLGLIILIASGFSGIGGMLVALIVGLLIAIRKKDKSPAPEPQHYTEHEIFHIVLQEAQAVFDIDQSDISKSLTADLRITPGSIDNLLEDLAIDYHFPISSTDRKQTDTLLDIISLITQRTHPAPAQ